MLIRFFFFFPFFVLLSLSILVLFVFLLSSTFPFPATHVSHSVFSPSFLRPLFFSSPKNGADMMGDVTNDGEEEQFPGALQNGVDAEKGEKRDERRRPIASARRRIGVSARFGAISRDGGTAQWVETV